jgi:hypothetical protein
LLYFVHAYRDKEDLSVSLRFRALHRFIKLDGVQLIILE